MNSVFVIFLWLATSDFNPHDCNLIALQTLKKYKQIIFIAEIE